MSQTKQILAAFLIPFILAAVLTLLYSYIFLVGCSDASVKNEVCFSYADAGSWTEFVYGCLIIVLFVLSITLPPLLTRRTYQTKKAEIELNSIIE
ncbi:MAG TPA: hypothetical protein VNB22_14930 [Pyrinomonadaceae bacterium]|nr:hypothetical protein [Pyrinomonadaceae bacterium]